MDPSVLGLPIIEKLVEFLLGTPVSLLLDHGSGEVGAQLPDLKLDLLELCARNSLLIIDQLTNFKYFSFHFSKILGFSRIFIFNNCLHDAFCLCDFGFKHLNHTLMVLLKLHEKLAGHLYLVIEFLPRVLVPMNGLSQLLSELLKLIDINIESLDLK